MDRAKLKEGIDLELANLERLTEEIGILRHRYIQEPDFIGIRAAASILHDFYCGVEKIFERIALSVDRNLPDGENWHMDLYPKSCTFGYCVEKRLDSPGEMSVIIHQGG